ncbi:hypothetical protein [Streptomyces sp. NPDC059224]|uniref:hypothetical protein n=1 Tax=Streptomyces sp. NPDC059224 TaxID=3346775 RepID=UPI0036BD2B00
MDLTVPDYAYAFGFSQADGHLSKGAGRKSRLGSITERTRSADFAETHTAAVWTLCSPEARTTVNGLGLPYGPKSKTIKPPPVEFSRRVASYLSDYGLDVVGVARNPQRHTRDDIYNVLYMTELAQRLAAALNYPNCLGSEDRILLNLSSPMAAAEVLGRTTRSCSSRLWCLRNGTASPHSHR